MKGEESSYAISTYPMVIISREYASKVEEAITITVSNRVIHVWASMGWKN
jgi:hypothetical protein